MDALVAAEAVPSFLALLASEHEMLRVEASVVLALTAAMSEPMRRQLTTEALFAGLIAAGEAASRVEIMGNLLNVFASLLTQESALLDDHRTRILDCTRVAASMPLVAEVPAASAFAQAVLKLAAAVDADADMPGK